ncbi:hypothetical protein LCGC14_1579150 [marine sediment metagenome]|uniref:HTH cro/C1-type domain-containing protein n=1 Tax=marine sediment metagenome TaxID=412755 RepID=A0A0F9KYE2_9ZZZZ
MELDTIGKRIKFARIILGLTQPQVASMMGARSNSKLSNWETDRCKPCATVVPKLAKVLKCTPAWLYFGDGLRPV